MHYVNIFSSLRFDLLNVSLSDVIFFSNDEGARFFHGSAGGIIFSAKKNQIWGSPCPVNNDMSLNMILHLCNNLLSILLQQQVKKWNQQICILYNIMYGCFKMCCEENIMKKQKILGKQGRIKRGARGEVDLIKNTVKYRR